MTEDPTHFYDPPITSFFIIKNVRTDTKSQNPPGYAKMEGINLVAVHSPLVINNRIMLKDATSIVKITCLDLPGVLFREANFQLTN